MNEVKYTRSIFSRKVNVSSAFLLDYLLPAILFWFNLYILMCMETSLCNIDSMESSGSSQYLSPSYSSSEFKSSGNSTEEVQVSGDGVAVAN